MSVSLIYSDSDMTLNRKISGVYQEEDLVNIGQGPEALPVRSRFAAGSGRINMGEISISDHQVCRTIAAAGLWGCTDREATTR